MTDERGTFTNPLPTTSGGTTDADAMAAAQAAHDLANMAANRATTAADTTAADTAAAAQALADQTALTVGEFNQALTNAGLAHDDFDTRLNAITARLDAIQLTPGPAGDSAYQTARNHGYSGTETQWLATLKGNPGSNGRDGTDGTSATISIGTITTLTPGSQATATLTGTTTARILNLGIPAGSAGTNGTNSVITIATGTAPTVALALAAQTDIIITLDKTMPNTTYNYDLITPAALIGTSTITYKARTTTTITFTLKATVAITASALSVIAWTN